MQVLVAAASRHGSTAEIAQAIGEQLRRNGIEADVRSVAEVDELGAYDAVVLGSAVYVGRWLPEAVEFAQRQAETLRDRPAWLFSSGPIGSPEPMPRGDPEGVAELAESISARGHRVFTGRIERDALSLGERIIVKVVRAPSGDFRDWPAVSQWADEISRELGQQSEVPAARQRTR